MMSSGGKPAACQQAVGTLADGHAPLDRIGLPLLVEGHDHRRRAIAAHLARVVEKNLLPLLQADGVDDALALQALESRLEHAPLGGIEHHRHPRDVGLRGDEVEEAHHRRFGVEHALVHVDVDHLRAARDLLARHLDRRRVVACLDELAKARGAGHVGALAHVDEQRLLVDRDRLQAGETGLHRHRGNGARRAPAEPLSQHADVLRGRAAAAAEDVDQARGGVFLQDLRSLFRCLVVFPEGVRQARVRVSAHPRIRDTRQLLDVRTQLTAPQRAVESHRERAGVADGVPERFRCLARENPPGSIGDGAGDHDRHFDAALVEEGQRRVDRSLGVQRIDYGLDEEEVDATQQQRARRIEIGRRQLVERGAAVTRIVDIRGQRAHAAGGPERARHESRPSRRAGVLVRGHARQSRGAIVQFRNQRFGAVVGLRHRVGIERVGLDDVRAGLEVRAVYAADDVGPRERQDVVVALEIAAVMQEPLAAVAALIQPMLLHHRAHGAVEQHDALIQQAPQALAALPALGFIDRRHRERRGGDARPR